MNTQNVNSTSYVTILRFLAELMIGCDPNGTHKGL